MGCLRGARVAVSFLLLAGCGGERPAQRPDPEPGPSKLAPLVFERGADSGKVDKVGFKDGALKPDGVNDLAFRLTLDGPIQALFLVAVSASGSSNGQYQADTLIGDQEVPKVISTKWGNGTAGLGVVEQDVIINAANGSLSLPAAQHQLSLYIAHHAALAKGARLRAYVQRPDGAVDASNILVLEPTADAGG